MKNITIFLCTLFALFANSTVTGIEQRITTQYPQRTTKDAVIKKLKIVARALELSTGLVLGAGNAFFFCYDIATGNVKVKTETGVYISLFDTKIQPYAYIHSNLNKYILGLGISGLLILDGFDNLQKELRTA